MDLAAEWLDRLRPEAAGYARLALENIAREFPTSRPWLPHWLAAYAVLLFS